MSEPASWSQSELLEQNRPRNKNSSKKQGTGAFAPDPYGAIIRRVHGGPCPPAGSMTLKSTDIRHGHFSYQFTVWAEPAQGAQR